jgi:hypothetical protein
MEQNTAPNLDFEVKVSNLIAGFHYSIRKMLLAVIEERNDINSFESQLKQIVKKFKGIDLEKFDVGVLVNARFFWYNIPASNNLKQKMYDYFDKAFGNDWQNKDVSHVEKSEKGIYVDPATLKPGPRKLVIESLHPTMKKAICATLNISWQDFVADKTVAEKWFRKVLENFKVMSVSMDLSNIFFAETFFNTVVMTELEMKNLEKHFLAEFGQKWIDYMDKKRKHNIDISQPLYTNPYVPLSFPANAVFQSPYQNQGMMHQPMQVRPQMQGPVPQFKNPDYTKFLDKRPYTSEERIDQLELKTILMKEILDATKDNLNLELWAAKLINIIMGYDNV